LVYVVDSLNPSFCNNMKEFFSKGAGNHHGQKPLYSQPNLPGMFLNTSGNGSLHQVHLGSGVANPLRIATHNTSTADRIQIGRSCLPPDDRE